MVLSISPEVFFSRGRIFFASVEFFYSEVALFCHFRWHYLGLMLEFFLKLCLPNCKRANIRHENAQYLLRPATNSLRFICNWKSKCTGSVGGRRHFHNSWITSWHAHSSIGRTYQTPNCLIRTCDTHFFCSSHYFTMQPIQMELFTEVTLQVWQIFLCQSPQHFLFLGSGMPLRIQNKTLLILQLSREWLAGSIILYGSSLIKSFHSIQSTWDTE